MTDVQSNGSLRGNKRFIFLAASAVIAIGIVLAMVPSMVEGIPSKPMDKVELHGVQEKVGFYFDICGEERNPSTTQGTYANPISLEKGGRNATLDLCVRSTDTTTKTWQITAVGVNHFGTNPPSGIHVTFDKKSLGMPAYPGDVSDFSKGKGQLDRFKAYVSADNSTAPGLQGFAIMAEHPTGQGYSEVLAQGIYVNIK